MKKFISLITLAIAILMVSCSGTSSTKLSELCDVYAEIADNKAKTMDAFQKVYSADRNEQELLQEKATTLAKDMNSRNEELANKANELGEALLNSEIPCEVGTGLSYKIEKAVYTTVQTNPNLANIVITATPEGEPHGKQYVLMLDENGEVLVRTMGICSDGEIKVNFRVTTDKGSEIAKTYGAVRKLKFVSESEYKTGVAQQEETIAGDNVYDNKDKSEPEAAYKGEEGVTATDDVTVDGVTIRKGAPLAATLRKFKKISWDYNADFGVIATIGNVWISIDESDLTQKGQDIINAIPSDMENDISFSIDYIKPSAKITRYEVN